jgi:hypothetical protein
MGLAANRNQDAMIWVVSETIRRVICMAQAMRPGVAFETVVGDVFNLPGSSFVRRSLAPPLSVALGCGSPACVVVCRTARKLWSAAKRPLSTSSNSTLTG